MKLLKERGFALIELLVVIAIIGVLATVVISSLSSAKNQATDKRMQKMLHNLQIKLEVYHLDNSEYPRGTFYSYTNPEEGPWQREHSLVALAELLDVDPNDLYPCSKYDQQCETRFTYQSPDSNSLLDNCWKNHYTLEYSIQNPTTPFQPRQQFPCGPVSGSFGNDEIPSYCDESNLDVWDEWLCNILRDQAGQEFYLYIN